MGEFRGRQPQRRSPQRGPLGATELHEVAVDQLDGDKEIRNQTQSSGRRDLCREAALSDLPPSDPQHSSDTDADGKTNCTALSIRPDGKPSPHSKRRELHPACKTNAAHSVLPSPHVVSTSSPDGNDLAASTSRWMYTWRADKPTARQEATE